MSAAVLWLAAGLILIVAEVLTGTFYLLVLGLACLAGSAVSLVAPGLATSSAVVCAIALFGVLWVRRYRSQHEQPAMASLDVGQSVRWQNWIDESARLARVAYRDSEWEALVTGEVNGTAGEVLYITGIDGNRLTINRRKD